MLIQNDGPFHFVLMACCVDAQRNTRANGNV